MINNDLVAAVHASRRYLENILQNICLVNGARLPYKDRPYYLMEYFIAAEREISFQTQDSDYKYYYEEVFFEIDQTKYLGNAFVHGEDDELTFNEASTFCDAVYDLHDAVTCEECGSYVEFNRKTNKGVCSNKNCLSSFDL